MSEDINFVCPLFCGWRITLTQEDIDRSGCPTCPEHEQTMIAYTEQALRARREGEDFVD